MSDKVSTHNPIYDDLEMKRKVYRAVKGGTDALHKEATAFLPKYPAESGTEYSARLNASTIDGIVAGGVETLVGSVFDGDIGLDEVNQSLLPFLENVDNRGNHFNVFVRDAFEASFEGHSVILVDMPAPTDESKQIETTFGAEADRILNKRPYFVLYRAGDVINWRYRENPVTKMLELVLLVVKVVSDEPKGTFETEQVTRYRVWMLEGSTVKWQLWREDKKNNTGTGETEVLESEGTIPNLSAIPAAIVGELTDEPKLLVESRLEVKAYQKESSFDVIEYLSVPTFFTKGYEGDEPLALGAAAHLKLPIEGDVGFAQIDAAGHESLKGTIRETKEFIKARLNYIVTSAMKMQADKTATEVNVETKDKQARLVVWAQQLKDAVELALGFAAEFMGLGKDKGGEVVFNTKWMAEQAPDSLPFAERVDIANKLDGLVPHQEQLRVLYPDKDESELAVMLASVTQEQAVRAAQEQMRG